MILENIQGGALDSLVDDALFLKFFPKTQEMNIVQIYKKN